MPAMPEVLAEDAARHPQQMSLLDMEAAEEMEVKELGDNHL